MPPIPDLPTLTVVMPCLNQAPLLQRTIRSVLLQRYPRLQFVIVDRGSTDGSVEIIHKYRSHLSPRISRGTPGHTEALNQGLRQATGDLVAWVNPGHCYYPGAFVAAAKLFREHPQAGWVCGGSETTQGREPPEWLMCFRDPYLSFAFFQPSIFLRTSLLKEVGPLDESLQSQYALELFFRIYLQGRKPLLANQAFSSTHLSENDKPRSLEEARLVARRYKRRLPLTGRLQIEAALVKNAAETALWDVQSRADSSPPLGALTSLIRSHPYLLLTRPFLGAIRRSLFPGTGATKTPVKTSPSFTPASRRASWRAILSLLRDRKNPMRLPLNGQIYRQKVVEALFERISFESVIETGTFQGATTRYLRNLSKAPIVTFEVNPMLALGARVLLRSQPSIRVVHQDSTEGLKQLSRDSAVVTKATFFYLDAHWLGRQPLKLELEIIEANWKNYVVMIDDFQVPDDEGYAYDDYGALGRLNLEYLGSKDSDRTFFPAAPSVLETGARRGCVVLAGSEQMQRKLSEMTGVLKAGARFPHAAG